MFLRGRVTKQRRTQHNGRAGSGIHAKQAGVGKWISGEGLHQRPGKAKRAAAEQELGRIEGELKQKLLEINK